jgi:hypothetical protein
MKAHAELKNLLKGKKIQAFVKDMCLHAYPWTERIPVEYLEYKIFVFPVAWFKRVFYLKNTYKGALSIPSYVFF